MPRPHLLPLALAALVLGPLAACDAFVDGAEGPIDRVVSDSLDTQDAVPFLVTGVKERFNDTFDLVAVYASLLSDEGFFDTAVDGATFTSFDELDDAELELDNNSVDNLYDNLNEYRYLADDLLRRADETIAFSDDDDGAEARRQATFAGHLHGGIARYLLATYFGRTPTEGGGVITLDPDEPGPFIPSAELYRLADERLEAALALAATDGDRRLVNSLLARNALYAGDPEAAAAFAAQGLVDGDAPYAAAYASTSVNNWWINGGRGRTQVVVDDRFKTYADAGDLRVEVEVAPTRSGQTGAFYRQALYPTDSDAIPFMSWQETALIRAETAASDAEALPFLNAVRADAGLAALDAYSEAALIEERDRALFTLGARLVDQRRFSLPFTNPELGSAVGPWRYFPIPQNERTANPNL